MPPLNVKIPPEWKKHGACVDSDPDKFYPQYPTGRRKTGVTIEDARAEADAEAKAICVVCVVRTPCLEESIRNREYKGIWGGLDEFERKVIFRERGVTVEEE